MMLLAAGVSMQNGVETVCNNETTPVRPDFLLGEFTTASENRISETFSLVSLLVIIINFISTK